MAKKAAKKPAKKAGRAPAAKKSAKKTARASAPVKGKKKAPRPARPREPRSVPLPGYEGVRYTDLDNLCESIGDVREQANQAKTDEKGYKQEALVSMHRHNITQYRHAGVELVRLLGDEKLSVRLLKGDGGGGQPAGDDVETDAPELDPDAGDVLEE